MPPFGEWTFSLSFVIVLTIDADYESFVNTMTMYVALLNRDTFGRQRKCSGLCRTKFKTSSVTPEDRQDIGRQNYL